MHECTSIVMNSFYLLLIFFFTSIRFYDLNKGFIVHRGEGTGGCSFKKQTKTKKGWGSNIFPFFQTFFYD